MAINIAMNAFFAGLQSLIITVRRNAVSTVFTTIMLLALILAWSARGNIATFLEKNPSPHQEAIRFDESVLADASINETLETVRMQINADRVLIRQFHNSKADLTGLPFASVSTTYYSLAPGVMLSSDTFQPYPLSTVNEILAKMFVKGEEPHCVEIIPSKDISNPVYRNYLKQDGVVVSYACPMRNLKGQPVGFITAGYLTVEKKRPSDQEIKEILDETGVRVVGYVSQVIHKERKPWYETIFTFGE